MYQNTQNLPLKIKMEQNDFSPTRTLDDEPGHEKVLVMHRRSGQCYFEQVPALLSGLISGRLTYPLEHDFVRKFSFWPQSLSFSIVLRSRWGEFLTRAPFF